MSQTSTQSRKDTRRAKLLLLVLGVVWGLNWPAVKVSLSGVSPWTLRTIGLGAAACTLFVLALVRGRALHIGSRDRVHIVMTGLLNIALFNILLTFAQLGAATSRVAIITYSMPLWATLFARVALGEKLDRVRGMGLALGAGGLTVLISPLIGGGLPHGIVYALAAALTWAAGTVYMKWARINAEPLAIAAWQLLIGALVALTGLLSFEGWPHPGALHLPVICALAYHIFFGMAAGYILWFEIIAKLPAGIAALGTLLVPVVGVSGAVMLLGERPSTPDMLGFVLIFGAAICVLLPAGSLRLLRRT
ncbi:EamA family transporter [Herbaspirillum sp. meg3]|jgi:drug/metabolite transporter (DMT)-like permease|uniref:DMT family transporter n=1 Tax=Herbaspirillum sp. meg3 TaxID=2025949 RepID=UPI000B994F5D|nr:EamA family transporter [Herbaspirillum sp. meg3]ASU36970.1 EamA family transporter [Herbaspirillum sp. meg3]